MLSKNNLSYIIHRSIKSIGISVASIYIASFANEGGNSLEIKHEYFWDRNDVWAQAPAFSLKKTVLRKWILGWEQEFDVVSGASRRLGSKLVGQSGDQNVDAVSGASQVELRYSENPSITYSNNGTVASGSVYVSRENDYSSFAPAGSFSYDLFDRNTTVGVSYSHFFDDFHPQKPFDGQGGKKDISSTGITLAQSLTPLTLIGFTGTYVYSNGYLGHPYNPPMTVTGAMMDELVPNEKHASAVAGQVVQGFHLFEKLASINTDVRRYMDSWGLKSSTVDFKYSQYFTDASYIRFRVRYYDQTGTAFAKTLYAGNEVYRTADIRFFPFHSWLAGIKLSVAFPDSWDESTILPDRFDIKYDYLIRNTHGDHLGSETTQRQYLYQLYDPSENYDQGSLMVGLLFNL